MKRKIISILLVLAMAIAFVIPALAASTNPDIKAAMDGNGSNAKLKVTVDKVEEIVAWSNNATTVVTINGYVVSVAIKGNKVDKVTWVAATAAITEEEPIVIAGAPDVNVFEGGNINETNPYVSVDNSNPQFHCNALGGNGRVWPMLSGGGVGMTGPKKISVDMFFNGYNEATKTWDLVNPIKDADGETYYHFVCPKCGSDEWISFSNKSGVPDGKNIQLQHPAKGGGGGDVGSSYLEVEKTVDGTLIGEWATEGDIDIHELISGISFYVYAAILDDGAPVGYDDSLVIGSTVFETDGVIRFSVNEELNGWYAVVEVLESGSLAEELFEVVDPLYVYFAKGTAVGGIGVDFDYSVLYTIVNGWGGRADWGYPDGIGYPGLNNSGDIFYIGVTNTETGAEYPSFCAHAGSLNFAGDAGHGCTGYMCALSGRDIEAVDFDNFLSALNYIEDTYGNVNDNRVITQVVTWALLGNIKVNTDDFENTRLTDYEKYVIKDVLANIGYVSANAKIVDVAYLTCDLHGTTEFGFANCQPQLVPIYGEYIEIVFDNKANKCGAIAVNVGITTQYDEVTYEPVYEPVTAENNEKTLVSEWNHSAPTNGQATVKIDLNLAEDGYDINIADSSPSNRLAGYSYKVKIDDGMLIVSFDDKLIKADVGIAAGTKENFWETGHPNGKDGTAQGVLGEASGNYSLSVALPQGEDVYLFFHIKDGIKWYTGEQEFVGYVEVDRKPITGEYDGIIEVVIEGDDFYFSTGEINYSDLGDVVWPDKLAAGTYTVTLSSEDFDDQSQEVEIVVNDVATVDFLGIVVNLPDVEIGKD